MANIKKGFNYYNVDTDRYQDYKIKRLKKTFGCSGIAVYDYILCEIYRVEGCGLVWDENRAFDVAEYFGLKESLVNEIVKSCGVVGLFDKDVLSRGVITSLSIQKRYLEMCKRAKRQNIFISKEYNLIPEESSKLPEECRQNSGSLPQSKVKYISPLPPYGKSEGIFKETKKSEDKICPVDIDWKALLEQFNQITGKSVNVIPTHARTQITNLLLSGYTKENIVQAFMAAAKDKWLLENKRMLHPEYITRPENFYKYVDD